METAAKPSAVHTAGVAGEGTATAAQQSDKQTHPGADPKPQPARDRKSTRLNSTLSLHGALPICKTERSAHGGRSWRRHGNGRTAVGQANSSRSRSQAEAGTRSEEHTAELHSVPTRRSSDLQNRAQCTRRA